MSTNLIGKQVNGYEILSQVGQGGMATVFLARQRSMNRNVALKFLPAVFLNDDTYLQRFEREVKIVAQLEHRNIVPVYDYGECDDQPYIAMRYMPAGSVEELLAQGQIPLGRVVSIVEQVASALDYAHEKGILHRDLKPSNILLDDGGGVFITDFGIASILSEGSGKITTQGVVGTPSYMSPEQAQAEPLDGRSDVYALGVVIFELVTGRRPFVSDTPYSIAVMQVTLPPPSPRELEPGLSSAMERVILRALRKDPNERYGTAGELAQALRQALDEPAASTEDTDALESAIQAGQPVDGLLPSEPSSGPMLATAPAKAGDTSPTPSLPRMVRQPPPTRRRRRMWLGAALGGLLGCGLLLGLLFAAVSAFGLLSLESERAPTAEQIPVSAAETTPTTDRSGAIDRTATAGGEPERSPAQVTRAALNAAADATFTAGALIRGSQPATAPPGIQPVGLRDRPVLNEDLRGARGELVYFAKRQGSGDMEPTFEIVTLNLGTWETRRFSAGAGSSTYPRPSPDGRWIAFQSDSDGDFDIYIVNRTGGQLQRLTNNSVWDRLPAWSPAGDWLVFSSDARGDQTLDLYQIRPNGDDLQPLYSDGWRNSHARYSPDGNTIAFTAGPAVRDANTWEIRLYDRRTGASDLLTENGVRDASPAFSPDGQRILFVTTFEGARALASMNLLGEERAILYTGPGSVWAASYSPDGRYIVVTATRNGEDQLFLMDAAGGSPQQITSRGGAYASWMPAIDGD